MNIKSETFWLTLFFYSVAVVIALIIAAVFHDARTVLHVIIAAMLFPVGVFVFGLIVYATSQWLGPDDGFGQ